MTEEKKHELRILNVNVRSVVNKADRLECLTILHNPHVVAVTETWLHKDIQSEEVFPSSYNVLRRYRANRGGGVALLIKNTLQYEPFPFISDHESVWCKLVMADMTLVIGVIYRAPASPVDYLQKIDEELSTLTNSRSRIILIGDFNLPSVDWDARVPGSMERSHADSMLEIMTKYGLIQTVKKPTRTQGNCNSLLDLIFLSGEAFDYKIDFTREFRTITVYLLLLMLIRSAPQNRRW